jgi:hypothetical protein
VAALPPIALGLAVYMRSIKDLNVARRDCSAPAVERTFITKPIASRSTDCIIDASGY